jgi:hypothetical protein
MSAKQTVLTSGGKANSQFANNLCTWLKNMVIRWLEELVTVFIRHTSRKIFQEKSRQYDFRLRPDLAESFAAEFQPALLLAEFRLIFG